MQNGNAFKFKEKLFISQSDLAKEMMINRQRVSEWVNKNKNPEVFKDVKILTPPNGFLYRKTRIVDQVLNVIERIKTNPSCRRLIVSAWNSAEITEMSLPPCHAFFQFKVYGNKLSLKLTQRSADMFLGVPFNIASYALLLHIVAKMTGLVPHQFIHSFGDCHIYKNHIDQVKKQLLRLPRELPQLIIADNNYKDPKEFKFEDFTLVGYNPHPAIKGDVSV